MINKPKIEPFRTRKKQLVKERNHNKQRLTVTRKRASRWAYISNICPFK